MREIIYIQAGGLANYTATHFWNTQESYIPYGEDDPQNAEVESKISFSESVDEQERITCYPRALIFDAKVNFGTLSSEILSEDDEAPKIWPGNLVEYRQEAISKSAYHTFLDEGGEELEANEDRTTRVKPDVAQPPARPAFDTVRYWSDFSRVYYRPRSLQKVGNALIPEDNDSIVSWQDGQQAFRGYDKENDVMDDAVRHLVEDCDNMGAVQILSDVSLFGAFTVTFLEVFRDEYPKPLSFSFPFLSGSPTTASDAPNQIDSTKKLLTEAFTLRALKEFSSMNVPLYNPTAWCESLEYPPDGIYHRSALLSSLVETSTLPFRLKRCSQDIVGIWAALNSRNNAQFAELSGVFPYTGPSDFDSRVYNLSSSSIQKFTDVTEYARVNVSRGFSAADTTAYEQWISRTRSAQNACYVASIHAPAYPTPSSFPVPPGTSTRPPSATRGAYAPTMMLYSSLTASSNTASTFKTYAVFVDKLLRKPSAAAVSTMEGITRDELQELASDLWTMHDGWADDLFEDEYSD